MDQIEINKFIYLLIVADLRESRIEFEIYQRDSLQKFNTGLITYFEYQKHYCSVFLIFN